MSTSNCPVCHGPVGPADDICENCGAVLSTVSLPSVGVTASAPHRSVPTSSGVCPNCQQPVVPGEDICEYCGAVLSTITIPAFQAAPPQASITQPAILTRPTEDECPRCHARRLPGKSFCGRCGFKYANQASPGLDLQPATPEVPPVQLTMGSVINNKYKIVKPIGSGGMGSVYLAEDLVLKRQVVIKTLLTDATPDMVAQSIKEREFLASIKHANIVSIYDFITMGQQGYIVMEYVQGRTLEQILEEQGQPFSVEVAIRHILGILPTFSYLAKLGLVYCDFKPQNVMVEQLKDGSEVVKLIDLGTVIKYTPRPDDVYGTHGFYAPEAVKNPSPETDLYSICRTLAYMVTLMDLANPIFGMPSSEYYKAFRDYPALYRLLYKGTHPKPAQRFHSAEELSDQLNGVLRLVTGGALGMPVNSRLFLSNIMTTTGKLGLRCEAALDEKDKAIGVLRYGDQALRSGNFANALTFYRQALHVNPMSVDAHLRLAEVLIEQGEFSQALAEVTKVQRMAPGNWKIAWYTGRLLEAEGKLTAATDQYRELMADLPGELPPQLALARVSARQGNDSMAVDLFSSVLKADPGNTDAILGVTNSFLNLKRWDDAAQVLSSVSEAAAKYVDAQLLLCDLYINRMTPLSMQNVERASHAVQTLSGRTEDARYFLIRGDIYRAAWQLARQQKLPPKADIAGISNISPRALGSAAEESYKQYLLRTQPSTDRE
ncbi:MAG: tetratricopeptide repeat protein, partial [Ktedonobacteraceae bacterium]|nr:tetratricopeptide repeat protein [Ktedonobacteraceae bacterium]